MPKKKKKKKTKIYKVEMILTQRSGLYALGERLKFEHQIPLSIEEIIVKWHTWSMERYHVAWLTPQYSNSYYDDLLRVFFRGLWYARRYGRVKK